MGSTQLAGWEMKHVPAPAQAETPEPAQSDPTREPTDVRREIAPGANRAQSNNSTLLGLASNNGRKPSSGCSAG